MVNSLNNEMQQSFNLGEYSSSASTLVQSPTIQTNSNPSLNRSFNKKYSDKSQPRAVFYILPS